MNRTDVVPGASLPRLVRLCRSAVERLALDLRGRTVVTEAATGAFAVTPVLAALSGADEVRALGRDSRHGSRSDAFGQVGELARALGVADRIRFVTTIDEELFAEADVITNSGHLRPIDSRIASWCRPGAAVALMFEPWELRPGEVDLEACRRHGLQVAGTNEHHPVVDIFAYSGVMAAKLLLGAGVPVYGTTVLLLCDNVFEDDIAGPLRAMGAHVVVGHRPAPGLPICDAVVVALRPRSEPVLGAEELALLAAEHPGAVVVQFWGDVDRAAAAAHGVSVQPAVAPAPGHMGVLPSDVGPDAIVVLQAAGLKVGEILTNGREPSEAERDLLLPVFDVLAGRP